MLKKSWPHVLVRKNSDPHPTTKNVSKTPTAQVPINIDCSYLWISVGSTQCVLFVFWWHVEKEEIICLTSFEIFLDVTFSSFQIIYNKVDVVLGNGGGVALVCILVKTPLKKCLMPRGATPHIFWRGARRIFWGLEFRPFQIFWGCVFVWVKIDSLGFGILDTRYFGGSESNCFTFSAIWWYLGVFWFCSQIFWGLLCFTLRYFGGTSQIPAPSPPVKKYGESPPWDTLHVN